MRADREPRFHRRSYYGESSRTRRHESRSEQQSSPSLEDQRSYAGRESDARSDSCGDNALPFGTRRLDAIGCPSEIGNGPSVALDDLTGSLPSRIHNHAPSHEYSARRASLRRDHSTR